MCSVKCQFSRSCGKKPLKSFAYEGVLDWTEGKSQNKVNPANEGSGSRLTWQAILLMNRHLHRTSSLAFSRRWSRGVSWDGHLPCLDDRVAVADH